MLLQKIVKIMLDNESSCNESNHNSNWIEDKDEIPVGVTDVMLTAPELLDDFCLCFCFCF